MYESEQRHRNYRILLFINIFQVITDPNHPTHTAVGVRALSWGLPPQASAHSATEPLTTP